MDRIILFMFATSGLSWILTKAKIFKPFREWLTIRTDLVVSVKWRYAFIFSFFDKLFNCEGCIGFWIGIMNYFLIYKKIDFDIFCFACAGTMSSLLIIAIANRK